MSQKHDWGQGWGKGQVFLPKAYREVTSLGSEGTLSEASGIEISREQLPEAVAFPF